MNYRVVDWSLWLPSRVIGEIFHIPDDNAVLQAIHYAAAKLKIKVRTKRILYNCRIVWRIT